MDKRGLQERMFQTTLRFRQANMSRMLPETTPGEYKVLEILSHFSEDTKITKPVYVSEMASYMGVSSPAVSRLLKHMEEREFIRRDTDVKDRRNTCVFLTEKGIEKREECRRAMTDFMDRIIERMKSRNMQELLNLLNQMLDIMEDELKKAEKGDSVC